MWKCWLTQIKFNSNNDWGSLGWVESCKWQWRLKSPSISWFEERSSSFLKIGLFKEEGLFMYKLTADRGGWLSISTFVTYASTDDYTSIDSIESIDSKSSLEIQ